MAKQAILHFDLLQDFKYWLTLTWLWLCVLPSFRPNNIQCSHPKPTARDRAPCVITSEPFGGRKRCSPTNTERSPKVAQNHGTSADAGCLRSPRKHTTSLRSIRDCGRAAVTEKSFLRQQPVFARFGSPRKCTILLRCPRLCAVILGDALIRGGLGPTEIDLLLVGLLGNVPRSRKQNSSVADASK